MTMRPFPTEGEIESFQARASKRGQAARMMAGDSDKVEAGNFYTVSKSFELGDNSWTELFWEVLTVNGPRAFVRIHERKGKTIERFWEIEDRAWYLANDAWGAREVGNND